MNNKELITALKAPGRYQVYVISSGIYAVYRILEDQILLTIQSDRQLREEEDTTLPPPDL